MDTPTIQQFLKDGIAAIKQGDRTRGRELLLQVVAADERSEPAWLWLSAAMDDPKDKLVALENALAINPHNAQARVQLQTVQKQLGIAQLPPPAPAPPAPPPLARLPSYADPDEDPFQCAYCGQPAKENDTTCPHCGRSLLVMGSWQETRSFRNSLTIINGIDLQLAILQTLGGLLAVAITQGLGFKEAFVIWLAKMPIVTSFFGDIPAWARHGASLPFGAALTRDILLAVLFMMVYSDMDSAFYVALGVGLLDLGWSLVGAVTDNLGPVAATINFLFALGVTAVGALALWSRGRARVRLEVKISKDAHGALGMYQFGKESRHRGQWALAALYFQKALALKPAEARFYKDAGVALAQVGRYAKALRVLEEGARRAPGDGEIQKLMETIRREVKSRG
jgi:tetratricopeptide (TPR) repeat protein